MKRVTSYSLAFAIALTLGSSATAGADEVQVPPRIVDVYGHPLTGLAVELRDGTIHTVETPPEARVSCYEAHQHERWQRACRQRKFRHRKQLVAWQVVLHSNPQTSP